MHLDFGSDNYKNLVKLDGFCTKLYFRNLALAGGVSEWWDVGASASVTPMGVSRWLELVATSTIMKLAAIRPAQYSGSRHSSAEHLARTTSTACNRPGHWDAMISYTQRNPEAAHLADKLYTSLQERGMRIWLDVKMDKLHEDAMQEAAENSKWIIAIVTGPYARQKRDQGKGETPEDNAYFGRELCVKEIRWARAAGVLIQPVVLGPDKGRIGELMKLAPNDLQDLGANADFIDVYSSRKAYWNATVGEILTNVSSASRRRSRRGRSRSPSRSPQIHPECWWIAAVLVVAVVVLAIVSRHHHSRSYFGRATRNFEVVWTEYVENMAMGKTAGDRYWKTFGKNLGKKSQDSWVESWDFGGPGDGAASKCELPTTIREAVAAQCKRNIDAIEAGKGMIAGPDFFGNMKRNWDNAVVDCLESSTEIMEATETMEALREKLREKTKQHSGCPGHDKSKPCNWGFFGRDSWNSNKLHKTTKEWAERFMMVLAVPTHVVCGSHGSCDAGSCVCEQFWSGEHCVVPCCDHVLHDRGLPRTFCCDAHHETFSPSCVDLCFGCENSYCSGYRTGYREGCGCDCSC